MSIEIIEKPTHKCSVCGCVFSFDKEDLENKPFGLHPQTCDVYAKRYLQCPVCGTLDVMFEDNVIKI